MSSVRYYTQSDCPFDIQDFIQCPPMDKHANQGNNVLHFNSKNRHYKDTSVSSAEFVQSVLKPGGAMSCKSDSEILFYSIIEHARKLNTDRSGVYLEFGYCSGRSLNFIASLAYDKEVYGFDSGEGLPEIWREKFEVGLFRYTRTLKKDNHGNIILKFREMNDESCEPFIPFIPLSNTTLVQGLISESLPKFCTDKMTGKYVAFLFIDTDIKTAAQCIFAHLKSYIIPGKTIIVLDEGYNFVEHNSGKEGADREWENHEFEALKLFQDETGYDVKWLAYNANLQQLAFMFVA